MMDTITAGIQNHRRQRAYSLLTLDSSNYDNIAKSVSKDSGKKLDSKEAPSNKSSRIPQVTEELELTKHEKAQLLFIKNNLKKEPCKAYEVFNSLSEFAQSRVPQKELDRLVSDHHKQAKIDEEKLLKEKSKTQKSK